MAAELTTGRRVRMNSIRSKVLDYCSLTKPEINVLIVIATSAGYVLGSEVSVDWWRLARTLIGTLLVASGTATLNQFMERVHDGEMRRTHNRPVPSGRVRPQEAMLFGIALSISGVAYLAIAINPYVAGLAAFTLISYLLVYTPLKRATCLCTYVGAIPGATPILIGWYAARPSINVEAVLLFLVLLIWQFPHFLAIALMYREDYERASYRMLPAFDTDGIFTRLQIVCFTVALSFLTLWMSFRGSSLIATLMMAGVGAALLYYGIKLAREKSRAAAGHLLRATIIYLPTVFVILVYLKSTAHL